MRITDLDNTTIKHYLSESLRKDPLYEQHWNRIDEEFFKPWQKYLSEVALTPDQVSQIFAAAEKQAGAAGGGENSTMLGKIVDKIIPDAFLGKLEKSLPPPDPNAQPDPQFEQKASAAVQQLDVPADTKGGLMKIVAAAVKNPAAQGIVLSLVGGVLGGLMSKAGPLIATFFPGGGTAAVAITGAIVAGGVAIASAKLQGKGWKEAFTGAIKPALAGAAGAVVGQMAANFAAGAVDAVAGAVKSKGADATAATGADASGGDAAAGGKLPGAQVGRGMKTPDGDTVTALSQDGLGRPTVELTRPDGTKFTISQQDFFDRTGQQGINPSPTGPVSMGKAGDASVAFDASAPAGGGMKNPDGSPMTQGQMKAAMDRVAPVAGGDADPNKYYNSLTPAQQRAADDAVVAQARANRRTTNNSIEWTGKKLSEGQVYMLFKRITAKNDHYLAEGRLAEGPMDWVKTKAKNLTTKITADKLNSAWQKAGSPMDSDQLAAFLADQGVSGDVVSKVYADLKLPAAGDPKKEPAMEPETPGAEKAAAGEEPQAAGTEKPAADPAAAGAAATPAAAAAPKSYKEVRKLIMSLNAQEKEAVMAHLQQKLGTA